MEDRGYRMEDGDILSLAKLSLLKHSTVRQEVEQSTLYTLSHSCLKVHASVPIVFISFSDPLVLRINCLVIRELLNTLFLNPESSILEP